MKRKNDKSKALETILVLVGALIILDWSTHKKIFLLLALILIMIATVSDSATAYISRAWLKLAELMGTVMSKLLLSLIFFVVLMPAALLYRFFGKDNLQLKKKEGSYYYSRDHVYLKNDIENIW